MAVIFVGKQFFLSIVEYHLPRLWKLYNTFKVKAGIEKEDKTRYPQWIQDFRLVEWGHQGLFHEYLEMGMSTICSLEVSFMDDVFQ